MKAKLICYDLSNLKQIKKVEVKRILFGYTEYSNNSKYTYKREGILKNIPHFRPARAVIIVAIKDGNRVIKAIKDLKGKCKSYDIQVGRAMLH